MKNNWRRKGHLACPFWMQRWRQHLEEKQNCAGSAAGVNNQAKIAWLLKGLFFFIYKYIFKQSRIQKKKREQNHIHVSCTLLLCPKWNSKRRLDRGHQWNNNPSVIIIYLLFMMHYSKRKDAVREGKSAHGGWLCVSCMHWCPQLSVFLALKLWRGKNHLLRQQEVRGNA